MKLLIINGPNLNMLGIRERHIYGDRDYGALCRMIEGWAQELGVEVELYQSNHEGAIVDRIQHVLGRLHSFTAVQFHFQVNILQFLIAAQLPLDSLYLVSCVLKILKPFRNVLFRDQQISNSYYFHVYPLLFVWIKCVTVAKKCTTASAYRRWRQSLFRSDSLPYPMPDRQ